MPAGLVLITPSSVTKTGTGSSATINTNGSVTFSSCLSLQLNDVFTSTYDNYRIVFRGRAGAGGNLSLRWVDGTTPNSSASSYTFQQYQASGNVAVGSRSSSDLSYVGSIGSYGPTGAVMDVYNPKLAQPTAHRSVSVWSGTANTSVQLMEYAGTHNQSTAYEGIYLFDVLGSTIDGLVCVYGWNQ